MSEKTLILCIGMLKIRAVVLKTIDLQRILSSIQRNAMDMATGKRSAAHVLNKIRDSQNAYENL